MPNRSPLPPAVREALTLCDQPAGQAWSLPPAVYVTPDVAVAEIAQIFRSSWICVGRADIVKDAGDVVTLDIAGQAVILLRNRDGALRAFANTCRHRGARLTNGASGCKGLRCPFHSWFYDLDGRLVSAPHMQQAQAFDRSDHGLLAYHVAERFGFVFLYLDRDPPDLDAQLSGFGDLHRAWPLGQLVTVRRQEITVPCNWKLFLDVFNEYYHLPFVHADSIDSLYSAPDPADAVDGAFASQFGATEGTGGLLEGDQDKALPPMPGLSGPATRGARYTWVFPNMAFAANSDALWCYEAYPLGADHCHVVQSACFHPTTMERADFAEKSKAYLARMDAALAEDVTALVNQQRGMQAPDARQGRFQPDLEPNVASFARWYSQQWHKS